MSSFSVQALQEKLSRLTPSQDSIETLSLWIIHHQAYASTSVTIWLESLRSADADHRLTLFYLANDILQNGRRRGAGVFVDAFKGPLKDAVIFVSGQKIQSSVERMLRIWRDRKVYESAYLKELLQSIDSKKAEKPQVPSVGDDFKLTLVDDAVMEFRKFEGEMKIKSAFFSNMRIDVSNTSSLALLKDKSAGGRFLEEFEETSLRLQDFCTCLGVEVSERANIATMLKECKTYHAVKLAELQALAQKCRNILSDTCSLKEKLEVRKKELDRAQHTSTSDPAAREDINDIGDMEIDADNEDMTATEKNKSAVLPHLTSRPVQLVQPVGAPSTSRPVQPVQPVGAPSTQVPLPLPPVRTPNAPSLPGQIRPLGPPFPPPPMFRSGPPTLGGFPPHGFPPNAYPPPHPASSMPRMGGPLMSSNPPGGHLGYPPGPPPMMHDLGIPPHNSGMLPHAPGMGGVPPTLGPPPTLGMGPPTLGMGGILPPPTSAGGILPASGVGAGPHPGVAMTGVSPLFPPSGPYSSVPGPMQKGGPLSNQVLVPTQVPTLNIPPNQLTATSSSQAPPPLMPVVTSTVSTAGFLHASRLGLSSAPIGQTIGSSTASGLTNPPINTSGPTNSAAVSVANVTVATISTTTGFNSNAPTSLDDRLKNLMTQKSFSKSLLHDYSDSSSDEGDNLNDDQTPYSPSMAKLVINIPGSNKDTLNELSNSPRSPTPEDPLFEPDFATTNPILKALFPANSPPTLGLQKPEGKGAARMVPDSLAQPSSSLLAGVDTHLLQSILNTIKISGPPPSNPLAELVHAENRPTSSLPVAKTVLRNDTPRAVVSSKVVSIPALPAVQPQKSLPASSFPPNSTSVTPSSSTLSVQVPSTAKPLKRDDIKFTPSLTSFLDKIFPELSKSLSEERKRKIDTSNPSEATAAEIPLVAKVPRTKVLSAAEIPLVAKVPRTEALSAAEIPLVAKVPRTGALSAAEIPLVAKVPRTGALSAASTYEYEVASSLSHAQNQDTAKRKERSPPSFTTSSEMGATLPHPPLNGSLRPEPSLCPPPANHPARPEDGSQPSVNFHRLGEKVVRPTRPPPSSSSSGNVWADDNFCWLPDDASSSPRQPSPLPPPQQPIPPPPHRLPPLRMSPPPNRMPPPHRGPSPFRDHPPPDFIIRDRSPPHDQFPHFRRHGDLSPPQHGPGRMDDAMYPTRYELDRYHGDRFRGRPPSPPPYHGPPSRYNLPPFRGLPPSPQFREGPKPYPRGPRGPNMFGPPPPFRPRFM